MIFARVLAGVGLALAPVVTAAQASPPGTDLYLAKLAFSRGELSISAPTRLTERPGYDNQPAFSPDGKRIYYTSIRGTGAESQADTWVLDLASGRSTAFTDTPESEYSPTPMPGGRELAVVRVEADSTQRLWAFPLAGGAPRLLLERIKPVGYQVWLDSKTVGVYVLGSPATFQVADLPSGTARVLLSDIGRSLQLVPGRRAVSVIHRVSETDWWLTEVDPVSGATRPVVKMPDGADYVVWLPDGSILTAWEHALLRFRPGTDSAFRVVTDLTAAGVGRISRLAVSPKGDRLALVAEEAP